MVYTKYEGFTWVILSMVAAYYVLLLVGRASRRKLLQRQTAVIELAIFGTPRKHNGKIRGTAVIAGGR
jgi:hypothetical protein